MDPASQDYEYWEIVGTTMQKQKKAQVFSTTKDKQFGSWIDPCYYH